ncbi:hypothetical protein EJB05_09753, partial [Eragrostis curvula]
MRGVRKRPWGRYVAEIRDPIKKAHATTNYPEDEPVPTLPEEPSAASGTVVSSTSASSLELPVVVTGAVAPVSLELRLGLPSMVSEEPNVFLNLTMAVNVSASAPFLPSSSTPHAKKVVAPFNNMHNDSVSLSSSVIVNAPPPEVNWGLDLSLAPPIEIILVV